MYVILPTSTHMEHGTPLGAGATSCMCKSLSSLHAFRNKKGIHPEAHPTPLRLTCFGEARRGREREKEEQIEKERERNLRTSKFYRESRNNLCLWYGIIYSSTTEKARSEQREHRAQTTSLAQRRPGEIRQRSWLIHRAVGVATHRPET